MTGTTAIIPPNFYNPSEFLGIFKNFFSNTEIYVKVLCLQGVYFKSDKVYGGSTWKQFQDENIVDSM